MAPFRPSRTTRSSRPGGNIDDNLFLDGLPVRQWRQQEATVGAPENYQASTGSLKAVDGVADALPEGWVERPMPKGSESYAPYSQMLLRAARMPKYVKSETGPRWGWAEGRADENDQANGYHVEEKKQKEGADSGTHSPQRNLKRKASAEGFVAKRWTLIPKEQEPTEEKQYLAKRREGLPPINGVYYNRASAGFSAGVTMYSADGQVLANGAAAEPTKRKGPPPRKKHKKGPGRGHKKVVVPLGENGANGVEGSTAEGATGTDGDVKMGDADDHEDDGEGEEGSEEEDGEEGDEEDGEGQEDTGMQNTPQSRAERGQDDTPAATELKLDSRPEPGVEPTIAPPPPLITEEPASEEALPPVPPVDPAPPSGSEVENISAAQVEAQVEPVQEVQVEAPEPMQIDAEVNPPVEVAPQSNVEPAPEPIVEPPAPVVVIGSSVSEAIHEGTNVPAPPIGEPVVDDEQSTTSGVPPEESQAIDPPPAAPVEAILNSPKPAAPMDAILNSPEPPPPVEEEPVPVPSNPVDQADQLPENVSDQATVDPPNDVTTEAVPIASPPVPPVERPEMESLTPPAASQPIPAASEIALEAGDKPKVPIPAHLAMPQPAEIQSPAAEVEPNYPSPLEEVPPQVAVTEGETEGNGDSTPNGLPQLIHQVSETESPPAEPAQKDPATTDDVAVEELPPAPQEG